jgi:hypothetical protein
MATPPPVAFRSAPPEAIYNTKDALFSAIQAHARNNGYAITTRSTKQNRILFDCDRASAYQSKGKNPNTHPSRQRNNTGTKKCGCKMRVAGVRQEEGSAAPIAHPAHRIASLKPEVRAEIIRAWDYTGESIYAWHCIHISDRFQSRLCNNC